MSKVSAELLRGPADDDEEPKKIYGVVTATVGPLPDPLLQGRVQVTLHNVDCVDLSSFARVATLYTGPMCGTYFVPNPGDEVLVAFLNGDVNSPFIIGSLWNLRALPPLPTQLAQTRAIRTFLGNQIVFSDAPPSVTIQSGAPAAVPVAPAAPANIIVTPAGIQIVVGATVMSITTAGIVMQAGGNVVSLTPKGVDVMSTAMVSVDAVTVVKLNALFGVSVGSPQEVRVTSPKIKLNSP